MQLGEHCVEGRVVVAEPVCRDRDGLFPEEWQCLKSTCLRDGSSVDRDIGVAFDGIGKGPGIGSDQPHTGWQIALGRGQPAGVILDGDAA